MREQIGMRSGSVVTANDIDRLIDALPESSEALLRHYRSVGMHSRKGAQWLLRALRTAQLLGLEAKDLYDRPMDPPPWSGLRDLANIFGLGPGESDADVIDALRAFPPQVLQLLLPYAGVARPLMLNALGWGDLHPFQRLAFTILGTHERSILIAVDSTGRAVDRSLNWDSAGLGGIDDRSDASHGVVDRATLLAVIRLAQPAHLQAYLKAFQESSIDFSFVDAVAKAVQGEGRAAVEKRLKRFAQAAIKTYGLFPVKSEEEAVQRYLTLRRLHKEASKFGPQRQLSTRAAVIAGLTNLAQSAGFADLGRLEWAMESRIAEATEQLPERVPVGEWEIALEYRDNAPVIAVSKEGKLLRSVPPSVRKAPEYAAMKERLATQKEQLRRFRLSLEGMMCRGEALDTVSFLELLRLRPARRLLETLVFCSGDGTLCRLLGDSGQLEDLRGEVHPPGEQVRIAHSYDLFQDGTLGEWQRVIVQRRVVQPFKQVFRELYLLTPAELETSPQTYRFAGHRVAGAVAYRLLQAREWNLEAGDRAQVFKRFRKEGLVAEFDFPDSGHFLAETDEVTTGSIRFSREDCRPLALDALPPLLFSETMRDADLVVSVAQAGQIQESWSPETCARRGELLLALASDLGLSGVNLEGHFLFVAGKRASYRIHIGSGIIHFVPGQSLCIVPAEARPEKFYLPYADNDPKTSEVVSKMLLLANDHKIKDPSILGQIERNTGL